ncbi:hypothetical protein ORD22_13055 [Sporosarcina sp. GW1-11]|uniref:hypothetical protein n=1 Tax=Sporosarcina sp. GW1-11 TaxID=2899126 RepID=UPI00294F9603|nr:hypothetical protein [Sporosarcina sp. GW1-11]MDV6379144.1 hypothetical protein [Sporosarcina sp. GW1-11]
MTNFTEDLLFTRELELLTDEYDTAPADIKTFILKDIQLLESAISLLANDVQ